VALSVLSQKCKKQDLTPLMMYIPEKHFAYYKLIKSQISTAGTRS